MLNQLNDYRRDGRVLTNFSFLKKDNRYISYKSKAFLKIEGAPGFNGSENIYSVGQPSVLGMENIIKFLKNRKIIWINLKEEPTIYINKEPYIVRDSTLPFSNISSFKSILPKNIENLESILKEDVVEETKQNGGFVCLFDEMEKKKLDKSYTGVYNIRTNREVFYYLKSKGYDIEYHRIPLTYDGFVSQCENLNLIVDLLEKQDKNVIFLLISSNDIYRSLFVCVMIKLFHLKKLNELSFQDSQKDLFIEKEDKPSFSRRKKNFFDKNKVKGKIYEGNLMDINVNQDYKFQVENSESKSIKDLVNSELSYCIQIIEDVKNTWSKSEDHFYNILKLGLDGRYRVVNNLMFVLNKESKILVDKIVAKFSNAMNLKHEILINCLKTLKSCGPKNQTKSILYLERYITLILFSEYMLKNISEKKIDFITWINSNPIFTNLYDYLRNMRHLDKVIFPINLLKPGNKESLWIEKSKPGRYTMLFEFSQYKIANFGNKINIITYPQGNIEAGVWINLREEPCIFIDNKMFVLKEFINYHKNPTCLSGISNDDLENFELRIKNNVVEEMTLEGKVLLFRYTKEDIEYFYVENKEGLEVLTFKEYFNKNMSTSVNYFRIPSTFKLPFSLEKFDVLAKIARNYENQPIYIQSCGVKGRSVYAAIIIDLTLKITEKTSNERITNIRPLHSLIRILPHGQLAYEKVFHLFFKYYGQTFTLLTNDMYEDKHIELSIKKFFLLVCYSSYSLEGYDCSFQRFFEERLDIKNLYNSIDMTKKEEIYINVENEYLDNFEHIKNRKGKVLGSMTIIKNDFFIGSSVFKFESDVEYPQNFRYVNENDIFYVGCAMPTQSGVLNTINKLKEGLNGIVSIMWFCLREEPVIYVNGSPYVLRYVTKLCENIETRGITYDTINKVEEELLKDAKNELDQDMLLLHDEITIDGKIKSIGKFSNVKNLETVNMFFESFDLKYYRVPITDEKAPSPETYDFFVRVIKSSTDTNAFIFNCQMGRGRTTTALIISYIIRNYNLFKKMNCEYVPSKYKLIAKLLQVLPNSKNSKSFLDFVISKFSHVEHLGNVVDRYATDNYYLLKKGKDYLMRYFSLLTFTEYVLTDDTSIKFVEYLKKHPEIGYIAQEIDIIGMETI